MALNKPAQQSSDYHTGGAAELAVDGNSNEKWAGQSITHTTDAGGGSENPWWYVDLQGVCTVDSVKVYNRIEAPSDCCSHRLSGAIISLVSSVSTLSTTPPTEDNTLATHVLQNMTGVVSEEWDPAGTVTNVAGVYISLPGTKRILSLAEVEVIGRCQSIDSLYVGCYEDDDSAASDPAFRVVNHGLGTPFALRDCIRDCGNLGYQYAAMQYGTYCFCDNKYESTGFGEDTDSTDDRNCNFACTHDAQESGRICGGVWRNSVYRTGI